MRPVACITRSKLTEADLVTVVWARASSVVPVITRDHPTGSIGHACNLTWRVGWPAGSYTARAVGLIYLGSERLQVN